MAAIVARWDALNRPCQVGICISDSKYSLVDMLLNHPALVSNSWLIGEKNWKKGGTGNVEKKKRRCEERRSLENGLLKRPRRKQHQVSFHWVKGHCE